MKKIVMFFAAGLLMASFMSFNVVAQDSDDPGFILLFEEFVEPDNLAQFWQVQQEAFDKFKEVDLKLTIWSYQTAQSSFYWATPIQSFAGIGDVYSTMMEGNQKLKDAGFDGNAKFRDLSNMSQSVLRWNSELSYHPEGSSEEGEDFHEWTFIYLKSGHEKEAAEAVQKYKDFYKSIGSDDAWDIYEVVIGEHTPCWILEVQAETEAALREQDDMLNEKYSADFMKLWQNVAQHVRTLETQKGWYLPNWSMNVGE